ncbi:MAG: hypothetical protein J6T10_06670 [Methanobrevibacter sp.]|nr:hypothetical protein [Methanobrevibacter sp.]
MNQYYEKYHEMAKEFHLEFNYSYICTLPNVHPADFVMKFDNMKKVICVAEKLVDCGKYICCYGSLELRPKMARQQLAKLIGQYKEILVKRKLKTIEKDFK